MPQFYPKLLAITCCLGSWLFPALHCLANETVVVILQDGRTLLGQMDQLSDVDTLHLRRELPGVQLTSQIPWATVHQVVVGEQSLTVEQVRQQLPQLTTPGKTMQQMQPFPQAESANTSHNENNLIQRPVHSDRVESLQISAQLANWDSDSQSDGIEVQIIPLNCNGELVPVNGQLNLALTVQIDHLNGGQVGSLLPEFRRWDRCTHTVRAEHFTHGPAVYRLPFRQEHPDARYDLSPLALLQAELGISGQGVFSASASDLCIRPVSYFRDQLQYYTQQRSLPSEAWRFNR